MISNIWCDAVLYFQLQNIDGSSIPSNNKYNRDNSNYGYGGKDTARSRRKNKYYGKWWNEPHHTTTVLMSYVDGVAADQSTSVQSDLRAIL